MSQVIFNSARHDLGFFLGRLAHQPAVLVQVDAVVGSVPREAGAWMAVFNDALVGTIGGRGTGSYTK